MKPAASSSVSSAQTPWSTSVFARGARGGEGDGVGGGGGESVRTGDAELAEDRLVEAAVLARPRYSSLRGPVDLHDRPQPLAWQGFG